MEVEDVTVYVKTPARLHLGLIDLNGNLGRVFGGLGVGIDRPNVVLEISKSYTFTVRGLEKELVTSFAKKFFEKYKIIPVADIHVRRTIPAHVGLGSGTQLALAVAVGLAKLYDIKDSVQSFALTMGRMRRTSVGTSIFEKGGLVVDGGKIFENGASISDSVPPLLFRKDFPEDWCFIVAIPKNKKGLANEEETSAFKKMPSMPPELAGKISRLIIMKLLPSLLDIEIKAFGEALTEIQSQVGDFFAQAQGGRYSTQVTTKGIELMQKNGAFGVGQSSWGPSFYGLVRAEESEKMLNTMRVFLKRNGGGKTFVARANNKGAYIRIGK